MEIDRIVNTTYTNLGPVRKGVKVCQKFVALQDNFDALSLWVATYRQTIDSRMRVSILDADRRQVIRSVSMNTRGIDDNSWQRFSFDPIADSRGKTYWFCVETSGNRKRAITLWTNNQIQIESKKNRRDLKEAICFQCHYSENVVYLLDDLLFRDQVVELELEPSRQAEIRRTIKHCIATKDFFFLRLIHLIDAYGRTENCTRVLSIGCGQGYQERFLAARLPQIQLEATDIKIPESAAITLSNIRFREEDILAWSDEGDYDFVFSIETLEHIDDYQLAFRNMARKVRPGGYLYISVPFASLEEQHNEDLKHREWEDHEHVLPGFTFEDLGVLFQKNGFDVLHSGNMFWAGIADTLNKLIGKLDSSTIDHALEELGRLFLWDLKEKKAANREEAVGIYFLGQKKL